MDWLFDGLASLLAFFYQLIPNYGISIILLTVVVMIVLTPLTIKGTKSMMMMQRLQPEIRKLQQKHKEDRQKLNEEMMALYKEHQINPVGGCLPLLAQAPVFIVLYTVLRGLTRRQSDLGYPTGWTSGSAATTGATEPPRFLETFDPAYLNPDTELYQSLSQTTEMRSFGMDLSESASRIISEGQIIAFIPYLLLIAIVAVTGFVQQRQIQGRMSKNQVNPQQQMIMKFLPIMLPIFSFTLPAGLVVYFAASNLFRVGQQWFISRKIYGLQRGETVDDKQAREGQRSGVAAATETPDVPAETNGSGKAKPAPGPSESKKPTSGKAQDAKSKGKSRSEPAKKKPKGSRRTSGGTPPSVQPRGRKKKR